MSANERNKAVRNAIKESKEDVWITASEAAEILGKTVTTVNKWCAEELIASRRTPSGRYEMKLSIVEEFAGLRKRVKQINEEERRRKTAGV